MEIGNKIKVGYAQDWMGQATRAVHIIAETTDGRFVCEAMPVINTRTDGSKYIASPMTGLFLRDKKDFPEGIKEEIIGG